MVKEMIQAYGMNPEEVLTREALSDGAATYKSAEDYENHQLTILGNQLKQLIREAAAV
jgi:hypothetical protein